MRRCALPKDSSLLLDVLGLRFNFSRCFANKAAVLFGCELERHCSPRRPLLKLRQHCASSFALANTRTEQEREKYLQHSIQALQTRSESRKLRRLLGTRIGDTCRRSCEEPRPLALDFWLCRESCGFRQSPCRHCRETQPRQTTLRISKLATQKTNFFRFYA
jgi:hypothetical protein